MANPKVTVTVDKSQIKAKLENAWDKSVAPLSEQILNDSNYYCKEDQGMLIASSKTHSIPKDGVIIWNTPYAKRQYYTGTPSADKNPNASRRWVEKAKDSFGASWEKLANKLFNGGM